MNFMFYLQSILLGVALAMDACAVSMANGLNEPKIPRWKHTLIAIVFGVFQALMPLIGYFVGHAFIEYIDKFIPWIALILLGFLGVKTIISSLKEMKESKLENDEETKRNNKTLTIKLLLVQAIATSIDALSVGLTISDYSLLEAIVCALIIALVTIIICLVAVQIGKKFGDALGSKAEILGGIILIIIGLEIFISSFF